MRSGVHASEITPSIPEPDRSGRAIIGPSWGQSSRDEGSTARGSVARSSTETGRPVRTTRLASDFSIGRACMASRSTGAPATTSRCRSWGSEPLTTQATSAPDTDLARSATACSARSVGVSSESREVISTVALNQAWRRSASS